MELLFKAIRDKAHYYRCYTSMEILPYFWAQWLMAKLHDIPHNTNNTNILYKLSSIYCSKNKILTAARNSPEKKTSNIRIILQDITICVLSRNSWFTRKMFIGIACCQFWSFTFVDRGLFLISSSGAENLNCNPFFLSACFGTDFKIQNFSKANVDFFFTFFYLETLSWVMRFFLNFCCFL